jgi:oligopeptide transport system ATP-binding protein
LAPILEVKNLATQFFTPNGIVHAVNGVSFTLEEGETLAIVGESGCGKSVSALSIMGLLPYPAGKIMSGEVIFEGQNLAGLSQDEMGHIRGNRLAMIFQDPMTSLNPVLTIGRQIDEALEWHKGISSAEARRRTVELLEMVGIPLASERAKNYPHQFSGGMRQRVMIAMGLSCNPRVLIADEPTTALDVTIQAQIVDLIKRLQKKLGMALIWITHDLGIVAGLADKVMVMYAGYVVEWVSIRELYADPRHPYTIGLLGSLPRLDEDQPRRLVSIEGAPPDLSDMPAGCPFYARCGFRIERCGQENPPLETISPDHKAACWVDVKTHGGGF